MASCAAAGSYLEKTVFFRGRVRAPRVLFISVFVCCVVCVLSFQGEFGAFWLERFRTKRKAVDSIATPAEESASRLDARRGNVFVEMCGGGERVCVGTEAVGDRRRGPLIVSGGLVVMVGV